MLRRAFAVYTKGFSGLSSSFVGIGLETLTSMTTDFQPFGENCVQTVHGCSMEEHMALLVMVVYCERSLDLWWIVDNKKLMNAGDVWEAVGPGSWHDKASIAGT